MPYRLGLTAPDGLLSERRLGFDLADLINTRLNGSPLNECGENIRVGLAALPCWWWKAVAWCWEGVWIIALPSNEWTCLSLPFLCFSPGCEL